MDMKIQDVFSKFSYGIYVVSVKAGNDDNAMIASWVSQCSHEPPLLSVAIRHNRLSHDQILKAGAFSIGILPKDSGSFMKRFKIPDWKNKFEGISSFRTEMGLLMPEDITGYIDCELSASYTTGDHTLFIGRATSGKLIKDIEPMTTKDYGGCYTGAR
jgi:flavin reductase (DIM6/NTAB) family NADH-FMN oxidoreductase RutF